MQELQENQSVGAEMPAAQSALSKVEASSVLDSKPVRADPNSLSSVGRDRAYQRAEQYQCPPQAPLASPFGP
jgi:hypothetical protein